MIWRNSNLDPDKFTDRTLAVTTTWFRPSTGETVDADIEFNGVRFAWGVNGEPDRPDVQSVALHEIGHLLGLGHTQDPDTVMFPSIRSGQLKRTLTADELAGMAFLYPGAAPPPPVAPLTATASASPTSGPAPLTVAYSVVASGGTLPYTFHWDFGDGETSGLPTPTHTYRVPGGYNAAVTVTDAAGRTAAASASVQVTVPVPTPSPAPTPTPTPPPGGSPFAPNTLSVTPTGAQSGDLVTWTVLGQPGQYAAIAYSTQDHGGTVSGQSLALGPDFRVIGAGPITGLGAFFTTLAVRDSVTAATYYFQAAIMDDPQTLRGFTLTNGVSLTVGARAPLRVMASASPDNGTAPLVVNFSGTVSGGVAPYTFAWTFGDGGTATGLFAANTYARAGTYTATLTARDRSGAEATAQVTIRVRPPAPVVSASGSPTSGAAPLPVAFTGSASGGTPPYSFTWSFSDGGVAYLQNPQYTFQRPGSYPVTLIVRDAAGGTATAEVVITVRASALSAQATGTDQGPGTGAPRTYDFTVTVTGGSPPFSFTWDFGDGTAGSGQSVTHTYLVAGTYTATVTVRDAAGQTVRASVGPIAVISPASRLNASASGNPTSGQAPLTVTFSGNASGGASPYNFTWSFGDGGTASIQSPSHTYSGAGTYTAVLRVRDAAGQTATAQVTITVITTSLSVTVSDSGASGGQAPFTVSFTATASGGTPPYSYLWDFGDGPTSTNANPTHTYTQLGTYMPTVTVTDNAGRRDSKIRGSPITVTASPSQGVTGTWRVNFTIISTFTEYWYLTQVGSSISGYYAVQDDIGPDTPRALGSTISGSCSGSVCVMTLGGALGGDVYTVTISGVTFTGVVRLGSIGSNTPYPASGVRIRTTPRLTAASSSTLDLAGAAEQLRQVLGQRRAEALERPE